MKIMRILLVLLVLCCYLINVYGAVTTSNTVTISNTVTPSYTTNSASVSISFSITRTIVCGNGKPDPHEECDPGIGNFIPINCCTNNCKFFLPGKRCGGRMNNSKCYHKRRCSGEGMCRPVNMKRVGVSCGSGMVCNAKGECVKKKK